MKKLFVGLAVVVGSMSFAQQFGIKAGMNLSSISNSDKFAEGVNSKSKIGFNAGVFMNAPISEQFSIQPEVLYNQGGSKLTGKDEVGNDHSITLNMDYISVPVMLQFNATPQFYLEAGPQFGFLVSSKLKDNKNDNSVDLNKDNFNSFDMGIGLGAGYYFNKNIGVTARYTAGLSDIAKDNPGDALKNNVFQVGLAYKF